MKFQLNKNLLGLILMIFFICLILLIIIRYKNIKDFKEDYINEQFLNITEDFKNKKKSSSKKSSTKSKPSTTPKPSTTTTTPKPSTTTKPSTSTTSTTSTPSTTRSSPIENYNESCDIKMDEWNKSPEEIEKQKQGLTKMQECQIKNLINNTVRSNVMETLSAQNPLMTGPSGPAGPPGPAGTTLLASGN